MNNSRTKTILEDTIESSAFALSRIFLTKTPIFPKPYSINNTTEAKITPPFKVIYNDIEDYKVKDDFRTNTIRIQGDERRNNRLNNEPYFQATAHKSCFCTKHQWSVGFYSDGTGYMNQSFFSTPRYEVIPIFFPYPVPSDGAKTITTSDIVFTKILNDRDNDLMKITIPNYISNLDGAQLEKHNPAQWHPEIHSFTISKYLYQWSMNYSNDTNRTNQTFFFIVKNENSSPILSDSTLLYDITTLTLDNITLNINVDNDHSDFLNITVPTIPEVRNLGVIRKTQPDPMAPTNFHRYQIESFYFNGA